jgi:streptogramin lyase
MSSACATPPGSEWPFRLAAAGLVLALAAWLVPAAAGAQGVTEFPIGSTAFPLEVVAGPDGNLWFTEMLNRIGRMTPSGDMTEFPVPT